MPRELAVQGSILQPQHSLAFSFSFDTMTPQAFALSTLAVAALGMLLVVTGGIVYLTAVEWRDRRRRDRDRRSG